MSQQNELGGGTVKPSNLLEDQLYVRRTTDNKVIGVWAGIGDDDDTCKVIVNKAVQHPGDGNDYSMAAEDRYVGADTNDSAAQITLPDVAEIEDGHEVIIDDEGGNANTNNITIATPGSETVDGSATLAVSTDDAVTRLVWDEANTNWIVV